MSQQTNVGGKPNKDAGLFDLTPEESRLRAEGAASREAAQYADYIARNSVAAGASGPGSFAGSNAAQVAAPYNLEPGLMSRTLDNTYASSRVPGRGGRQGGRNDVDRRQPGRDGRRGGIPFEGGQTYADLRAGGYAGYDQMNPLHPDNAQLLNTSDGTPTDPFTGGGGGGIGAAYENYFANQEKYAQEKFDSITDYLDQLQISSDEGFAADMDRISGMYDQRRDARNQRFEEALNRAGGRESAAIDTLAELGIQADANTFDPVTGETRDMLFSQQMSGADMLNSMSYITNTIYDFAKNEQDLAIGAGLENAQQNLLAEMAAIQMARDSKAISDAEAAAAAASAAEEAANLQQYYITMGQALGMTPEVAVAAGATGMFGDFFDVATETTPQTYEFPGYEGIDMTIDQAISAGLFEPQEGGIGVAIGGQPTVLPFNANFEDLLTFAQQYGIDVAPISSLQEG